MLTDSLFSCTKNISDEVFSLETPVFGYEFNDTNAPMLFLPPVSFPYGASHTDELQFLFTINGQASKLSSSEQTLATTMKSYWTNFANNGDPNSRGVPNWARFALLADNDQSLVAPTPSARPTSLKCITATSGLACWFRLSSGTSPANSRPTA